MWKNSGESAAALPSDLSVMLTKENPKKYC
jgi:hypothetical protein